MALSSVLRTLQISWYLFFSVPLIVVTLVLEDTDWHTGSLFLTWEGRRWGRT